MAFLRTISYLYGVMRDINLVSVMNKNDLKFEMLLTQLEEASIRLEKYKAKGWSSMVESTKALMAKLEAKIDALEA